MTRRSGRDRAGRFLAEGAQAVREALSWAAAGRGRVHELFVTSAAADRNPALVRAAVDAGVPVSAVTDKAAAALSETVTPQGVVAVCSPVDVPLAAALAPAALVPAVLAPAAGAGVRSAAGVRLVAVLHGVADPGNAGTVVRVADAAGADAVVFAGDTVDPHNGKCVRASTGSVFHLPIARVRDADEAFAGLREAGLRLVAADGYAPEDLVTADLRGDLAAPTAWVFGSEAHGLPDAVVAGLDASLKVPIYGGAESLNLATAAAVCLYASARAQRA